MKGVLRAFGRMTFIRFGIRDRIIRFFYNPDQIAPQQFEVNFFGKRYLGDFGTFIDWSVYFYGAYSIQELYLMKDAIQGDSESVIVDVGANVGHHTLFAASLAKKSIPLNPIPKCVKKYTKKSE